jgi:xylose isomerase
MDAVDLLHAHVGGVDVLARALLSAAALIEDGTFDRFTQDRYAGWRSGFGAQVLAGALTLAEAADHAVTSGADPKPISGRQEYLENLVNRFC